jgi:hypothetical protein
MRRLLTILACTVATAVALEVLMRAAEPPEIYFRNWNKNGVHRPDPVYGFRWTPGYDGYMRHPDGIYLPVPLRLNEFGFRMPVASTNAGPDALRVLLLGGRSMMFSYGLADADTIAGRMAAVSPRPMVVQNTALAGIDLYRNWHQAREQIEAFKPDVILVSVYKEDPCFFTEFAPDFTRLPPPPGTEKEIFVLWDGIAGGRSPMVNSLGRRHNVSYVLYGLCNIEDRILENVLKARRWIERRKAEHDEDERPPAHPDGLAAFLRHIAGSPVCGGAAVGVVLIPQRNKPADLYHDLVPLLPTELSHLDIHADLIGDIDRLPWIGEGHYGREASDHIARAMAAEALRLDAARQPSAPLRTSGP